MTKPPFAIIHNLDGLDKDAIKKYLADMSVYIGLDPALNGLDTIYMNDPQGGRALVPYARRGTCEILRNLYEVEVTSLTYATVGGSIVFTATGRSVIRGNRQEIAVGSKYVDGLRDKQLDNAIMTASTRAFQRLTMQFTELGILAESEVVDLLGQTPNPAGSAQLAANPMPPAFLPPPAVPANNAPGKPVEAKPEEKAAPAPSLPPLDLSQPSRTPPKYPEAPTTASVSATQHTFPGPVEDEIGLPADKKADIPAAPSPVSPVESTDKSEEEAAKKAAKKPRKKPNTVALDVEPEVVQKQPTPAAPVEAPAPVQANVAVPVQADVAVPTQANSAPAPVIEGLPNKEQMDEYRKKISVYTVQLPASQDLGPTQKMRAFITKMSGAAPQQMTVDQWEEIISFFTGFTERNPNIKSLVTYINDFLGVK
jgi:hypothetical protein